MADEPIDTSYRPSLVSTRCGGGCGQWVLAVATLTTPGYCEHCLRKQVGGTGGIPVVARPPEWASEFNPPPPPATYPSSPHSAAYAIRVADPEVTGRCQAHPLPDPQRPGPDRGDLHLLSLDPADIAVGYAIHDWVQHHPQAWLIGGPGGADGDICNPCGGGNKDKTPMEQPRHDLCLRGNPRGGWGRNCPCTHGPHMRGIKPGDGDPAARVRQVQQRLEQNRQAPVAAPAPPPVVVEGLWDPEQDWEDRDDLH